MSAGKKIQPTWWVNDGDIAQVNGLQMDKQFDEMIVFLGFRTTLNNMILDSSQFQQLWPFTSYKYL